MFTLDLHYGWVPSVRALPYVAIYTFNLRIFIIGVLFVTRNILLH